MKRRLVIALGAIAFAGAASAAPRHHATGVIPKYVGEVNADNAARFLDNVAGRIDKIVGLKVIIEPSTDADFRRKGYLAMKDGRLFSVSATPTGGPGQSGGVEMVAPADEVGLMNGGFSLDGFYVIKNGGMHQGTVSVGLEKVDEGAVLLSTKFRVVETAVR